MGAHARDGGVNFAVFSQHAERIEVCTYADDGVTEAGRHRLHGPRDGLFTGFLAGVGAGLVYGLRAHGPYRPEAGHLFNQAKLLLDPCAREIVGRFTWRPEHHGYVVGGPQGVREPDPRDNGAFALKARVAAPDARAPGDGNRPRHREAEVVLYEVHVKGFTQSHPGVPSDLRGTYAGLAHPAAIAHLQALGVTTLSLLPVQYHLDEGHLAERGLTNYWGYNTLGFFCPDPRLSRTPHDTRAAADEFRRMVRDLHAAGLEVVLDVVYNHTPEGSEFGPTLSFRGLDHANWYRLMHEDRSRCENLTGCGNTLNVSHPRVTQFVLDSLRYWVECMGVDGFRFDLAPVLGRTAHGFDPCAPFFTALRQDPVLAKARLIAEPWDAGPNGYQVGRFPGCFQDWNDRFRDAVRGYWLGAGTDRGEFARRFTASDDLFHHDQRGPTASVNFVSVHDGFTLTDVVSYARKHNLANAEDNRDGRDDELSANFGVEGPTDDAHVLEVRRRVRRAMLATLMLAQGTPMLCAGDEIGNSQQGNNNAYCQDNPTAWLDWATADTELAAFVARLAALRRGEPLLRHDRWFRANGHDPAEAWVHWQLPDGGELQVHDWHALHAHALACRITPARDSDAAPLMLLFNPEPEPAAFVLPGGDWRCLLDSSRDSADAASAAGSVAVPARSLQLWRRDLLLHES
jgi:glycogen operon protein